MRRYLLLAAVPAAMMVGSAFTACSGGGDQGDAGDAATDTLVKKDVQTLDVANDAPVEAGVTPSGTALAGGDGIRIWGVTSDGVVVFNDTATGGQYADGIYTVPAAGGTPTKIGTPTGNYIAGIAGKVVVVWDQLTTNGVGKIHTWTQGGTYASPTAVNVAANGAAASPDGQYVIFEANSNSAATVADIVGAKVDGTGQTLLASQVDVGPGNFTAFVNGCIPNFGFPTSSTALVTSCATNPGDAGAPNATVNSYAIATDGGTWASTPIVAANGLPDFAWDGDGGNGTTVFTATTIPTESVSPVTGGVATPVDTKDVNQGDWTFLYINRAGTSVLYNSGGALYTAATTLPTTPTAVQATGVNYVRALSSDENWLIYTTTWDKGGPPPTSFGSDLFLTKTTPGFTPVQLGTGTGNALFGLAGVDQFTTDSSHVLWIENVDTSTGTGDFYAMSLPSGTPTKIASGQWQNWSATGSKVVYEDNCALCSATAGKGLAYADIQTIDLSQTNPSPKLVQAGADVPLTSGLYGLYLSPTLDRIIYTYSQNAASGTGDGNGLYSVAIP